jgi:hypothetical protein
MFRSLGPSVHLGLARFWTSAPPANVGVCRSSRLKASQPITSDGDGLIRRDDVVACVKGAAAQISRCAPSCEAHAATVCRVCSELQAKFSCENERMTFSRILFSSRTLDGAQSANQFGPHTRSAPIRPADLTRPAKRCAGGRVTVDGSQPDGRGHRAFGGHCHRQSNYLTSAAG